MQRRPAVSEKLNEAPARYDPDAPRFIYAGSNWPNTGEAWSDHLAAIHDPQFWPSMDELDAWDARDARHEARTAWTEARKNRAD
jgi:hypothetical protein